MRNRCTQNIHSPRTLLGSVPGLQKRKTYLNTHPSTLQHWIREPRCNKTYPIKPVVNIVFVFQTIVSVGKPRECILSIEKELSTRLKNHRCRNKMFVGCINRTWRCVYTYCELWRARVSVLIETDDRWIAVRSASALFCPRPISHELRVMFSYADITIVCNDACTPRTSLLCRTNQAQLPVSKSRHFVTGFGCFHYVCFCVYVLLQTVCARLTLVVRISNDIRLVDETYYLHHDVRPCSSITVF